MTKKRADAANYAEETPGIGDVLRNPAAGRAGPVLPGSLAIRFVNRRIRS